MLNMDEAAKPGGADAEAYARAAASGLPLADFECRHGRLPHDPTPACGCHPQERRPILLAPISPATDAADLSRALADRTHAIAAAKEARP